MLGRDARGGEPALLGERHAPQPQRGRVMAGGCEALRSQGTPVAGGAKGAATQRERRKMVPGGALTSKSTLELLALE